MSAANDNNLQQSGKLNLWYNWQFIYRQNYNVELENVFSPEHTSQASSLQNNVHEPIPKIVHSIKATSPANWQNIVMATP